MLPCSYTSPRVAHGEAESEEADLESCDGGPVPLTTEPMRVSDTRRNDVRGPRGAVAWKYFYTRKRPHIFSGCLSAPWNGTALLAPVHAMCA